MQLKHNLIDLLPCWDDVMFSCVMLVSAKAALVS